MNRYLLVLMIAVLMGQATVAQTVDSATYLHLRSADKDEFISYAKKVGLATEYDTASQSLFAKTKGCIYSKPLGDKNNNEYYDLVLIVSTQNKENNKILLKGATEMTDKKGFWIDEAYLYREWDLENPISKEMWYKVLVYRKKK